MSLLDTASLICTPNAYKEGKLYSVIPSDGSGDLSVTRATTATRVNSQGLVELVPYNLLQYSEQFDNAAWAKETTVTVTPNVEIAPDGTLTADLINMPINRSMFQTFSIPAGEAATASVYIKGTAGETINFAVKSQNFTRVLTGEWQRIEATSSSSGTIFSVNRYGGGTASSFYLWGYQLVEGSVAKDYQKTETRLNIPRLDYSNGTCPSILVEPQRTNIALYSSSFNNAAWTKPNVNVTPNTTISPSGVQDADTLSADGAFSGYQVAQSISLTSGATYSISFYAKKNTNNFIQFYGANAVFGLNVWANFDLENGVVGSVGSLTTASIESVGNGWYRCSITGTATATATSNAFILNIITSATSLRSEANSLLTSVYIWGAQVEAGSYPTSYIPTTSASVTRNADVISKTGISSLIGQTEGVIFIDAYRTQKSANYQALIGLGNGTSSTQMMEFYYNASNELTVGVYNSGQQFVNNTVIANGRHKIALAYKANDFALYIDGVLIATDNSGTVPTMNQLNIGGFNYTSGYVYADGINAVALWKTRLTNTQLAQLTTI